MACWYFSSTFIAYYYRHYYWVKGMNEFICTPYSTHCLLHWRWHFTQCHKHIPISLSIHLIMRMRECVLWEINIFFGMCVVFLCYAACRMRLWPIKLYSVTTFIASYIRTHTYTDTSGRMTHNIILLNLQNIPCHAHIQGWLIKQKKFAAINDLISTLNA